VNTIEQELRKPRVTRKLGESEKALQESEKRYRQVVENATDIIYTVDEKGNFTYANPAGLKVTGYSLGELRKLNYADLVLPEHRERVLQIYINQFRERLPTTYVEFPFIGKAGEILWFGQNATLVIEEDKIVGFHVIARDITEQKRAEEVIEGLARFPSENPSPVLRIERGGTLLYANEASYSILRNWQLELGRPAPLILQKVAFEALTQQIGKTIDTEHGQRTISFSVAPIANAGYANFYGLDITERKKMEGALQKSEEKYRAILENIEEGYYEVDLAGNFTFLNNSMCRIFGYPKEELIGMNDRQYTDKENAKKLYQAFNGVYRTGEPDIGYGYEIIRKDGTKRYIEASILLHKDSSDKPIGFRGIIRDISERKRAEEALRESEEKYRTLVETSPDAITLMDLNLNIVMGNRPALNLYGYENLQEVIGQSVFDFVAPEDRPRAIEDTRKMLETGSIETREYKLLRKGGVPFPAEVRASLVLNVEKRPLAFICVSRDITERKRAEEALWASEKRFRELFDEAPVGYHEIDKEGKITRVNRTELDMLGYTPEEMLGRYVYEFVTEEISSQSVKGKLAGTLSIGAIFERTYLRKDGTTIPVLLGDTLIKDSQGRIIGLRTTIQNITERKQAEGEKATLQEQLRQSQKMEAIGRLAGGVAHDFNNILTVIKGYSQFSLAEIKQEDPLRENIEEIKKSADRAADLTRQLLAFSRRQIMEMKVLDLNDLFRNLDKMLRRIIGEDIELVTILDENLGRVKTDTGQIEQVIMNLSVNARDAMPKGGKLTIETANVDLDGAYACAHVAVKPGPYVMLAVSDTGVGMTPEVKERVFEPFFTTKDIGKGTGLGLSTVYGIVKQSGGNIWVYSEPGKGTTFKIYLPRVDEPLEKLKGEVKKEGLPLGSETVLIVEDDEDVRKFAARVLEKQGYTVLVASQGSDALPLCGEYKKPIHMVLCDVVMPGIAGRELTDHLVSLHPEMKVLYMSGYTENAIVHHGILIEGMNYIQKPFTVEGLVRKLREVLDKGSKPAA